MKKISTRSLTQGGLIAALYAVTSIALAPISFGLVQCRVSEALTLLPVLTPSAVAGVTIGCLITNVWGVAAGANILGAADVLFGTAATLVAALLSRRLKKRPVLAVIPPIVCNALVIGAELTWAEAGSFPWKLLLVNMGQIAVEEAAAVIVIGLPLLALMKKLNVLSDEK
jgi:uncharacterized membrane protein